MTTEDKQKINVWIPGSLWKKIGSYGYESPTKATIAAFEALALQEETGSNQEVLGSQEEFRKLQEEIGRYQEENRKLQENLRKAPDLVEFVQLQARFEGLQEIIRQKDEMIYILKQTNETLNTFAHYFKSMEVKQIGAQESKPASKEKPDIEPVSKPEVKQGEKCHIEKICKYCEKPFYTDNIQKEYCSKEHRDQAYNEKRRNERQDNKKQ